MKLGLCTSITNLALAERLGYDYLDAHAVELFRLSEEEFAVVRQQVADSSISVDCTCVLFSGNYPFYTATQAELGDYAERVLSRAAAIGVKILGFGSGAVRRKPEDLEFSTAFAKFVEKLELLADIAQKYGIIFALEPLQFGETDVINTLAEAALVLERLSQTNTGVLADGYHMFCNGEPVSHLALIDRPVHTHIALKEGRRYPVEETPEIATFFEQLAALGYTGRLSVEAESNCFEEDAAKALITLTNLKERYGL